MELEKYKDMSIPLEFNSGADPEFLERGVYMYKGVCVCGGGGVRWV